MFVFTGEIFEDYCLTKSIDVIGNMLLSLKVSIKFWILSRRKSETARPNIFKVLEKKKDTKACFFFFKKLFKRSCDFLLILTRPLWKIYFEQRRRK